MNNEDETFERLKRVSLNQIIQHVYNEYPLFQKHTPEEWRNIVLKTFHDRSDAQGWLSWLGLYNWTEDEFLSECKKQYNNK